MHAVLYGPAFANYEHKPALPILALSCQQACVQHCQPEACTLCSILRVKLHVVCCLLQLITLSCLLAHK